MRDRFTFDLQRFATFKGNVIGDETGVTLSELFNYAGKAWLLKDAEKGFQEGQTYFWGDSTLVELAPVADNADAAVAGALQLVAGRYDDPTTLKAEDGTQGHVIKSITAVDAEKLKGEATFKTIGSTAIVNPGAGAAIAIGSNTVTFGGDGNDRLSGQNGNDTLAGGADNDTLTGGAGNDTLTGGAGNDVFIYDAGNDVITDFAADDTLRIGDGTGSYTKETVGKNVVVNVGDNSITLTGAANLTAVNIDGREIVPSLVYTNANTAKQTLPAEFVLGDASARTKAIYLVGNASDNSIVGGSGSDSIYGKDGNDCMTGGKGNDYLHGQNGDDTLWGGEGNDTLKGGDGDDLFIYNAGNDIIADYSSGDKISLGAAVSSASLNGSDSVLKIGDGTLTIKDAKKLTLIDAEGSELTTIIGGVILDDDAAAKVTLASDVEFGDASARTEALWFVGNASGNSMVGGTGNDSLYGKDGADYLSGNAGNDYLNGQAGNDTLWGGAGNDTLKGGDGADLFIYVNGEGRDVIQGFGDDDLLQIAGTFTGTYNTSTKAIALKVGTTTSAITLKDFTATTFNINGDAYRISGTKLVK